MKKNKMRAKIVFEGVNIIDSDGSMLTGISDRDAIDLLESLRVLIPKIKRRARNTTC